MNLQILIDMNLSPRWVEVLERHGYTVRHWSSIGAFNAADSEILQWAKANDHVVFTHDLDFGAILAATKAEGPSVIQVRTQRVSPEDLESVVVELLASHAARLKAGALIIADETSRRVRILPLRR